jgi:prolyl-tRNA editing enzyme YbaK/EbsC (Cys-tRNA(Pro) deacylase)
MVRTPNLSGGKPSRTMAVFSTKDHSGCSNTLPTKVQLVYHFVSSLACFTTPVCFGKITMTDVLEARVTTLERKRFQCPKDIPVGESMRRAREHVESLNLWSANWKWVPPAYYDWSLEQRAKVLNASTTHMLCKSLLLENKKVTDKPELEDPVTNPRFMLVVIQYEATLDVKKLTTSIRKLRPVAERLDESQFDLRVTSSEDNDRITGYAHNSVTPFGLKEQVPIILSSAIVPYGYFWMGGGHVHLKLGMAVSDFLKVPNVQVMDLSLPRRSEE